VILFKFVQVITDIYSDLSRPPGGVITPSFHATPQASEVQTGLSRGCLCDRDGKGNKQ